MCSKINKAPDEDAIEDGQASVVVLQSPMPAGAIPPLVELPPVQKTVQKIYNHVIQEQILQGSNKFVKQHFVPEPAPQICVPTRGSSVHSLFMQISFPGQLSRVLHASLHPLLGPQMCVGMKGSSVHLLLRQASSPGQSVSRVHTWLQLLATFVPSPQSLVPAVGSSVHILLEHTSRSEQSLLLLHVSLQVPNAETCGNNNNAPKMSHAARLPHVMATWLPIQSLATPYRKFDSMQ
jgi:hypothetical protein